MDGIFGGLFDLNSDGEMSIAERALEFAVLSDMLDEDNSNSGDSDTDDWDD